MIIVMIGCRFIYDILDIYSHGLEKAFKWVFIMYTDWVHKGRTYTCFNVTTQFCLWLNTCNWSCTNDTMLSSQKVNTFARELLLFNKSVLTGQTKGAFYLISYQLTRSVSIQQLPSSIMLYGCSSCESRTNGSWVSNLGNVVLGLQCLMKCTNDSTPLELWIRND